MAANPSYAARVTPDLLDRLEVHISESGRSRSEILTEALVSYLNGFIASGNAGTGGLVSNQEERIMELEESLAALEELLLEDVSPGRYQTYELAPAYSPAEMLRKRQRRPLLLRRKTAT